MKWLLVLSLLSSVAYADKGNVQNLVYTSEGNRLIRRVTDNGSFYFEECALPASLSNHQGQQGQPECTTISPKFLDNPETLRMLNLKFKDNLRGDAKWARSTRNISALVLPVLAYMSGKAAYRRWVPVAGSTTAPVSGTTLAVVPRTLRSGLVTGAFTLLSYSLATAALSAWMTSVPDVDAALDRGTYSVEDERASKSQDPLTVYNHIKSVLVRTVYDRASDRALMISCGWTCLAPEYSIVPNSNP